MEFLLGIALIWFSWRLRRIVSTPPKPTRIIVEHVIRFEPPPPGSGEPLLLTDKIDEPNVVPFRRRA